MFVVQHVGIRMRSVKTEVPQGPGTKVTLKQGAFPGCGGGGRLDNYSMDNYF